MSLDPRAARIADDVIHGFVAAMATRDPDTILALFEEDASLFGSEEGETAIGKAAIRSFISEICAQPYTISWECEVTAAGCEDDVVWFVAPGAAFLNADAGHVRRIEPYRLSGVVRLRNGQWSFALFNGSEPSQPE